jgi:seryl-tRNA synthetase
MENAIDKTTARLLEYIRYKGKNDNVVVVECGLSSGIIGKFRMGKSRAGRNTLTKVLNTYKDLNEVWLMTGEGAMLNNEEGGQQNIVEARTISHNTISQSIGGPSVGSSSEVMKLIEEVKAQREVTQACQAQLSESQAHITELVKIIAKMQGL